MFRNVLALVLLAGFIAGCNTMKGVGQDIERGGEKMQDSAEKHKN
jgi:predicted small secreted protein